MYDPQQNLGGDNLPRDPNNYSRKACPFRQGHFCSACGMFDVKFNRCVVFGINSNLGRLAQNMAKANEADIINIKQRLTDFKILLEGIKDKIGGN